MKRRVFLKGSAAVAVGAGLGLGNSKASHDKPNVLFILVDQMRKPVWTPEGITPNFDRLAASGVSFENNFCSAVMCSPSRACLLTSTYTTQNRMFSNCDVIFKAKQKSLDPSIPTMGHVFGNAGYRTPYRGKWHLAHPKDRQNGLIDYGFEGWSTVDPLTGARTDCGEPTGGGTCCGEIQDPIFARQAKDWLMDPASRKHPWFMVCSLVNPHDICVFPGYGSLYLPKGVKKKEAPSSCRCNGLKEDAAFPRVVESLPENWTDDLSDKPRIQRRWQTYQDIIYGRMDEKNPRHWLRYMDYYVYCMRDMDKNLGTVLAALEESGQRENTIVVFTSDHGEMAGSHRLRTKGYFAYEEEMKVPLVFSMPGTIPRGRKISGLATGVDLMPTLTDLAGVHNPNYTAGLSLAQQVMSPEKDSPRQNVLFHADNYPLEDLDPVPCSLRAIRDKQWKYVYYFNSTYDKPVDRELYNLDEDPYEMVNLARDPGYDKKCKEMHAQMMEQEEKLLDDFEA